MLPPVPALRTDRLSVAVPSRTWGGGPLVAPEQTLIIFRSRSLDRSLRGATLAFYVDDWRFSALVSRPEAYARTFSACGFAGVIEPDFSLWLEDDHDTQYRAVFRTRLLGRIFQDVGMQVVPNLSWADAESFAFCFRGIPPGCPVAAVECRTAGQRAEDRGRFLAGLAEAVHDIEPQTIMVYGGTSHQQWLAPALPAGPRYVLLDSFSRARAKWRKHEAQRNQLQLFTMEAP